MEEKNSHDEMRKGPWTEQEDVQLVFYVNLFGDRRWDFVAKLSGLKRTGKSCRLRWANYLHPGLKRDKMTPHEERLVLELHSKWGNRWAKIAQKLPGRTDNEIKNYWRTHMRKKVQERKKSATMSPSSSSSNSSSSSMTFNTSNTTGKPKERSFYDTGGLDMVVPAPVEKKTGLEIEETNRVYSMDEIWKDIDLCEGNCNLTSQTMVTPLWDFCPPANDTLLWSMDQDECNSNSFPFYNHNMIG